MKLFKRLFLLAAAGLFALSLMNYIDHHGAVPREVETSSAGSSASEGYLVVGEGDRVCIRPLGGGIVRYVEGVRVSDLPAADREQLARGFTLPDEAALLALLEDYTG